MSRQILKRLLAGALLACLMVVASGFPDAPALAQDDVTVTVQVTDSGGNPLSGVKVDYRPGGSWITFGTTGPDGKVSKDIAAGTVWFRATYNNTSAEQQQDVSVTPLVQFQTSSITVEVKDSGGTGLSDAKVDYRPGGSWLAFGVTGSNGRVSKELFPGTYWFRATYNNTSAEQQQDISVTPLVQFQTSSITVEVKDSGGTELSDAKVDYRPGGSWLAFGVTGSNGRVSKELFPGTYWFRATYNNTSAEQQQDVSATPLVQFQTSNIVAEVKTCGGAGVSGVKVDYRPGGSWLAFGVTSSDGRVSKELFPGTYWFRAGYNNTLTEKQQDVGTTPLVAFQTTKVSFQFSGAIQYRPGGSWLTFTKPSMEMFPGSYLFKFGGLERAVTVEGCTTEKTFVILKLKDHDGNPLSGATGRGGYGSTYSTWHVSGTTDANGILVDIREGLATTMSYEMRYNNTTEYKTQDVSANSIIEFQTQLMTLRLETCSGTPLEGGTARYGSGSTFTSWWFPGGSTGANGETYAEFFPGTYSFEMQYQGTAEAKLNVTFPDQSPLVWQTTKLTLNYPYAISYGGATGDSRWFTKPSMELLPGTYKFHFRDGGGQHDLTIGGCEMGGNIVIVNLHNNDVSLTDSKYYLECSGIGKLYHDVVFFTTKSAFNCRARAGGIAGPWFSFNVADSLLTYEYATVHVTLYNDGDEDGVIEESEKLASPYKVEVSGVEQFVTGQIFHVPTGVNLSYRLRRNGIAGPWLKRMFNPGEEDWQLEFATVNVTLFNDADSLGEPHRVEVSGVGQFTTGQVFHVPPDVQISYRLRRNGIAGPWLKRDFDAGYEDWRLEFATVNVTLFNGDETLVEPHRVEVSGVGQFTTDQVFHVPPDVQLSYRLRRNGIAGPWLKQAFVAGDVDWQLEFATVHVTLFNDTNGDDVIQDEEKLGDPHRVEVSGVGQFTTDQVFHVPPDVQLSYRLRRNGIAGPWLKRDFDAGYGDWQLEFATVHVTLFNDTSSDDVIQDEEKLGDPHRVEVSGVGQFTTDQVFHVPPDVQLSYRLRRNGIAGPWLKRDFDAGYGDWQLEFATVHVTLFNGDETLVEPHRVEVSGVGQFTTDQVFHVPPDVQLSYRLRRNGLAAPWLKRDFDAGYEDWRLEFATVVFRFDLPPDVAALMSTEISGFGTLPHEGVAHLPPEITIKIRARGSGWTTAWASIGPLKAGEGLVTWGVTPEYAPPAP